MKARLSFNRLTILALIAAMMFFFKPAITQGYEESIKGDVEQGTPFDEGDLETEEETFGDNYQYTWVAPHSFSRYYPGTMQMAGLGSESCIYRYSGDCGANPEGVVANVRLPSGAYLYRVRFYYHDSSGSALDFIIYRNKYDGSFTSIAPFGASVNGNSYSNVYVSSSYRTIMNRDYHYQLWVNFNAIGSSLRLRGAQLYWRRQLRTGLSHPFNDLGGYGPVFVNSIAALYQSGITSGTSGTTYSPGANVTRAQMAVFLAKALGLYWSGSAGY